MSIESDLKEFEEQLRLQNAPTIANTTKTRVDPDGTVMEWDERRRAWFPKIDDDFIARYQMSYGSDLSQMLTDRGAIEPNSTQSMNWTSFNAQLAKLREEKGEDSEEVKQLTKSAHDSLLAYYNSPAYREWYEAYYKQHEAQLSKLPLNDSERPSKVLEKGTKVRYELKPSARMRSILDLGGEDPDEALARAEAELQAGLPLVANPLDTGSGELPRDEEPGEQQTNNSTERSGATDSAKSAGKRKQTVPPPAWYEMDETRNTHVYVNGLPPTITQQEFYDLMSKYGVIMNEPFTDKPRVKLYLDESGAPKGDGRCCYVKVESVELALKILDGMVYAPGYTLHVERAKFQPKGEFDPKRRRRLTMKEKKKLKEQQESLFRWGIDTSKFVRTKKERVLILKNVFVETDFLRDVTLIPVVRELVRVQCAKCGTVKKIVVHDANPLGVVTATFATAEEADTALAFLNGALFNYPGSGGARQLQVERWDGKTNYSVRESKDEETSRLTNWEDYLGGGDSSSDEDDVKHKFNGPPVNDGTFSGSYADPATNFSRKEPTELSQDYWETASSPERVDTEDELEAGKGGSSGDETA